MKPNSHNNSGSEVRSGALPPAGEGRGATRSDDHSATNRWILGSALAAILAVTAILYGHTLPFPFAFDDWVYLVENPLVDQLPEMQFWIEPRVFAALPGRMDLDPDLATNIMLRPFAYFTFYVNSVAGGDEPAGYRLVNILLHGANGCLVFLILRHIMLAASAPAPRKPGSTVFIPLVSALVFVAHPLQTESVTYIIQRFTSMACFFFLLTIWLHLRATASGSAAARRVLRCASVLAAILGMLTKELVFMAPLMIVLIEWLLLGRGFKAAVRQSLPLLCCMAIVPMLVLFTAWAQSDGNLTLNGAIHVAYPRGQEAHLPYLANEFRVILMYLGLLILPKGQTIDPDVRMLPNLFDFQIVLSGIGIAVIIVHAWLVRRRKPGDLRAAMIFVFTIWFFAVVFISSGLVPLPDLMAEHRAYLPAVGAIVAIVCLLDLLRTRLAETNGWRHAVPCTVVAWVVILGCATLNRNQVWQSRRSLWMDAVAKAPNKARPHANLGACYGERGRMGEAEKCFRRVLELEPTHLPTIENLATVQIARQRFGDALHTCTTALAAGVDSCKIRYNLGIALANRGRPSEGIAALKLALERNPGFRPAHIALGQVFRHQKKFRQAITHFRKAGELGADQEKIDAIVGELEHMITSAARQ